MWHGLWKSLFKMCTHMFHVLLFHYPHLPSTRSWSRINVLRTNFSRSRPSQQSHGWTVQNEVHSHDHSGCSLSGIKIRRNNSDRVTGLWHLNFNVPHPYRCKNSWILLLDFVYLCFHASVLTGVKTQNSQKRVGELAHLKSTDVFNHQV